MKIGISNPEYGKRKRNWFYSNNYWKLKQYANIKTPPPTKKEDNSDLIVKAYLE